MSKFVDLTGQKFGRLTVLKQNHKILSGNYAWLCRCDCNKRIIVPNNNLKNGHTQSCGCICKEGIRLKHGHSRKGKVSKTYNIWSNMKRRCSNYKNKRYKDYGGRGIKVCERWKKFENFLEDMGEIPKDKSLDRINNNGNYCPKNCKLSTIKEQNRNKRNNINITYNGKTQCLTDWAKELNINKQTVIQKLLKLNKKSETILNIVINSEK